MAKRILIRRDTTENWEDVNPILSNGELGVEIKSDGTRGIKLGTGSVPWDSLDYLIDNPVSAIEFENHENDTTAHGATEEPLPNLITMYNSDGGLKSNKTPAEQNDVIRKTELDAISGDLDDLISVAGTLSTDLTNEVDNRISDISGLKYEIDIVDSNLNDEIDNRILAVSGALFDIDTLRTDLTHEITSRISDISGLSFDIDALEEDLNNEIDNRISGISYLENGIGILGTDLSTETNNRQSDISGVLYNIETLETDIENAVASLETDLTTEVDNRISGISGAIYTASVDAANKANTAESNAKVYADGLTLATQQWLPSVQTTADLPDNPGTGTYLCRVITGEDNGVYQWIGIDVSPSWNLFEDNSDFIDKIANPIVDDIPIITSDGELIDSGQSISGILDAISTGLVAKEDAIAAGTTSQYYRGDKTWQTLPSSSTVNDGVLTIQKNGVNIDTFTANASADKTINIEISKSDVGLSNVDNTADANKPLSEAMTTALNNKEPSKYIASDETEAQAYSALYSGIMVFYPEE
jgi:hypothetical protein